MGNSTYIVIFTAFNYKRRCSLRADVCDSGTSRSVGQLRTVYQRDKGLNRLNISNPLYPIVAQCLQGTRGINKVLSAREKQTASCYLEYTNQEIHVCTILWLNS
jgi:hypothetical protein